MGPPHTRGEPECDPPPRSSRRLKWGPRRTSGPTPAHRDAAQIVPREAGGTRTGVVWGATPPMDSATPVTPALLPAQGRQRDGKRQSDPPPYRPRPGRTAGGNGARPPPPPPSPPLSAGAHTARQCPVASEMACQPWGIPRGRGVQTQAQAVVACLPLFFLPTGGSATRRDIPSSRARRLAIRRCGGPSSSTLHVSQRSGGASVRPLPPCTSVGDPAVLLSASYPCARQ